MDKILLNKEYKDWLQKIKKQINKLPFQGVNRIKTIFHTQGVAIGLKQIRLSALKKVCRLAINTYCTAILV